MNKILKNNFTDIELNNKFLSLFKINLIKNNGYNGMLC